MIINRQHLGWGAFFVLASAVAVIFYAAEFHPQRLPFKVRIPPSLHRDIQTTGRSVGGTPLGLIFGGVSAAIFVFAALLGLRRKRPTLKVGRLQTWLKGHIWLSLLTVVLIALHCGFSAGGPMTQWLLVVYAIVMLSGIYGLVLQHVLPRLMKERVPLETIFEQIPHIRNQLNAAAQEMRKSLDAVPAAPQSAAGLQPAEPAAASVAGTATAVAEPSVAATQEPTPDEAAVVMKTFMDEAALPYLTARRGERLLLGSQRVSDDQFRFLRINVGAEHQQKAEQLQAWCDERRQLDLQTKLQHWLHAWLLVHVPVSVLLLIFTTWHAVAALFFY